MEEMKMYEKLRKPLYSILTGAAIVGGSLIPNYARAAQPWEIATGSAKSTEESKKDEKKDKKSTLFGDLEEEKVKNTVKSIFGGIFGGVYGAIQGINEQTKDADWKKQGVSVAKSYFSEDGRWEQFVTETSKEFEKDKKETDDLMKRLNEAMYGSAKPKYEPSKPKKSGKNSPPKDQAQPSEPKKETSSELGDVMKALQGLK